MSRLLIGINGDLEEKCRSTMLNDNMELSWLMVHVQQVEDRRKKRGIHDSRRSKPQDQAGPSHGGHKIILASVSNQVQEGEAEFREF